MPGPRPTPPRPRRRPAPRAWTWRACCSTSTTSSSSWWVGGCVGWGRAGAGSPGGAATPHTPCRHLRTQPPAARPARPPAGSACPRAPPRRAAGRGRDPQALLQRRQAAAHGEDDPARAVQDAGGRCPGRGRRAGAWGLGRRCQGRLGRRRGRPWRAPQPGPQLARTRPTRCPPSSTLPPTRRATAFTSTRRASRGGTPTRSPSSSPTSASTCPRSASRA